MLAERFTLHRDRPPLPLPLQSPLHVYINQVRCVFSERERHRLTNRVSQGERTQRSRCFLIEWKERREYLERKKGVRREAWSEEKGIGEHLGYLKAFIQPWAGLDGCREVLTLDRTELESSCRHWIQQLLHRQLEHAFSSCGLIALKNHHRQRRLFFPLLIRSSIFLHQISSFWCFCTISFRAAATRLQINPDSFSLSRPYRAITLPHNKPQSCIPIGPSDCSTFTLSTWWANTLPVFTCHGCGALTAVMGRWYEQERRRNETAEGHYHSCKTGDIFHKLFLF